MNLGFLDNTFRQFFFGLLIFFSLPACAQETSTPPAKAVTKEASDLLKKATETGSISFYDFIMDDIDGKPVSLETFKGKVLLVVNTASFCGNTPQYEALQTIYHQYKVQGFEVLAFPANDFGRQEPGTNQEIGDFCYTKYGIDFPLFSKIVVKGPNKHPLYRYLTEQSAFKGGIRWNFQKYLLNRQGQVIARFRPGLNPLAPVVIDSIEKAISAT